MEWAVPITVLGGYLGAGKTTLLNRVLTATDRRLGVIVNDFGALGVDAGLLRGTAGEDGLIDLANGCVCCTLGNDLGVALEALAARRPRLDHIVIEASGVADPEALAAWGTVPGFAAGGVIVLAAADTIRRQADDRYVGGEVRRQLASGDLVLVTKLDLVDEVTGSAVLAWLRSVTDGPVVAAPGDADDPQLVVDLVLAPPLQRESDRPRGGRELPCEVPAPVRDGHAARYVRWAWTPSHTGVAAAQVQRFVEQLPDSVMRAKGIVGELELQVVGSHRTVTRREVGVDVDEGIVAIGIAAELDVTELDALADRHLRAASDDDQSAGRAASKG